LPRISLSSRFYWYQNIVPQSSIQSTCTQTCKKSLLYNDTLYLYLKINKQGLMLWEVLSMKAHILTKVLLNFRNLLTCKVGGSVIAHIRRRSPVLENCSSWCRCKNYGTQRSDEAVIAAFFWIFLTWIRIMTDFQNDLP